MNTSTDTGVRTVRAPARALLSKRLRAIGALFALCMLFVLPGISHASGCAAYSPISITVASGGTYTIDLTANYGDCAYYGTTLNTPPSHGTYSNSNSNPAGHIYVYYTNKGDGATSDSFTFLDDVSNVITVNVTILPAASPISITPTSFSFTGGTAVSTSFSATGGTVPYGYSVSSGSLPAGLSLGMDGSLTGTPTAYGSYSFTITATDSLSVTGTQSYTGSVAPGNLTISPASPLTSATITIPYSVSLSGNNGITPYSFAITDPANLPPGITLSGNTLSGTPTTAGTYNFHIAVTDSETDASGASSSNTVVLPYQLTVQTAPTITVTPNSVSDATVGVLYTSMGFTASGGATPYTYTVSAGSLPAGMTLASDGTLSGTPTQAGAFNFTVQAKDANNFTGTTSSISMTVNAPTITVGPGSISSMQVGVPYSQQFTASGGTQGSGYTFAATGTVPAGLSLSSGGLLSGTPTSATGSASFTVTATDQSTGTGAPFSGSQGYTVSVAAPTLTISPVSGTTLTAATQGSSYSQQFTASGGTSYTYAESSTLPAGLSFSNATGLLSGTPTQAGTFNFTVTATDSSTGTGSPFSVSGSYTLNVQVVAPVANPVSDTVSYGSSSNVVPLSFSGGTPTSVAIASPASHGTATASGTTITYTPTSGYTGTDSFTYTGTNSAGTSAAATVSITVSGPTLAITSSSGGTSLTATVGQSFTQTFTFSGGKAPYSGYSITGIPAGLGITGFNNTSITISGTPTVSGTFSLGVSGNDSSTGTDPSSGVNAPFTVNQTFSLVISVASMSVSPASGSLPNATVGTLYSQTISASGGIPQYAYSVTSGSLPPGLVVTSAGNLKGTPTAGGSFSFTVTATDSSTGPGSPANASASYTLTVGAPTITLTPSSLPGALQGSAYSQQLSASGGTTTYTYAVTSGALPTGMTMSSGGLVSGTPTAAGNYNFTVTAKDSSTGTGPYTGSQAYALSVSSNPPVANNDTASTLQQQAVTIPVTGNDTGSISTIAIAQNPSNGTATVSGLSVIYTPSGTFNGSDSFTYTATGPGGTSTPATVTVTVNPVPVAAAIHANAIAGTTVRVNLSGPAQGGPFTGAQIVSVTPASGGTAQIVQSNGNYLLKFDAATGYAGDVLVSYTLSNAYATSAPATVTITVTARPDPTRDAEVMGILNAQTDATRRFMRGQIDNFQSRLESLHDGHENAGFQNNLSLVFGGGRRGMLHGPQSAADFDATLDGRQPLGGHTLSARGMSGQEATSSQDGGSSHGFSLWADGALNFGTQKLGGSHNGIDFNTAGLTVGADKRLSDQLAVGGGVGYGHDASDVGKNGSRSTADAYNVAGYASYRPGESIFLDGVIGYQWLSFGSDRYVSMDGNVVHGSRNGSQVFGSFSAGFEHRHGSMMLSPYGRLDVARAQLDAYTEQGDALYALHYDRQTVRTTSGTLGLRMTWSLKRDFGLLQPLLRVAYRHDFQGSSDATMSYADMVGPLYRAAVGDQSHDHTLLGLGLQTRSRKGLMFRIEYQNTFESSTSSNQSILLHLERPFD